MKKIVLILAVGFAYTASAQSINQQTPVADSSTNNRLAEMEQKMLQQQETIKVMKQEQVQLKQQVSSMKKNEGRRKKYVVNRQGSKQLVTD